jgi:hypothetical protein
LLPALAALFLVILIKGRHHRAEVSPDPPSS